MNWTCPSDSSRPTRAFALSVSTPGARRWATTIAVLLLLGACQVRGPISPVPQTRSMADMRALGAALQSWCLDTFEELPQAEASPTGAREAENSFEWGRLEAIALPDIEELLTGPPRAYLVNVPTLDGYGNPYEVLLRRDHTERQCAAIRSLGADGRSDGAMYERGPFSAGERNRDIVWADGEFVAWPAFDESTRQDHAPGGN